ncbi:MAG: RHS repeat-associated core domain-containing protein [Flavobacteriaceae bacterium]|nr:RHS repeat-associated core domain-containing protein [Flavobacteriaceae bacterium]
MGSSSTITNQNGTATNWYEYMPFGEMLMEQTSGDYDNVYKYNGKELDESTGLYYYGARYYDPRTSIWLSVDPLAEKYPNIGAYVYTMNNPIKFVDPTGMEGVSTHVTKNKDGTYTVVGGNANDGDRTIYVVNGNGKRTGEVIGQSLTTHSFFDDNGKAVKGTIINPRDTSGIDFLNNEIIGNKDLGLAEYVANGYGGQTYDFKKRGGEKQTNLYRGMLFRGVDGISEGTNGTTTFASARDIGNVAAGYVAGSNGLTWAQARMGFDGLESWQKGRLRIEAQPTQQAQRMGYTAGIQNYAKTHPFKYSINPPNSPFPPR